MEPTTERIVPPKTGLPSMNTDLLARYGMNVLPAPIRFVRLSTSGCDEGPFGNSLIG